MVDAQRFVILRPEAEESAVSQGRKQMLHFVQHDTPVTHLRKAQ